MSVDYALQDVTQFLTEPDKGDFSLKHNKTFEKWNNIYNDVVDTINKFIGYLDDVGAGIPKIPWTDLYNTLVVPLAGDYSLIGQNADACTKLKTGMHAWAGNIDRIRSGSEKVWDGEAASAFRLQMAAYTLVMDGIGECMEIGTAIFHGISLLSQALGVCVEDAIVKAGQLIEKVAKKVLSKVSGIVGWLSLGWDLASHGLDYFRDLISDVTNAIDLIQDCFNLKDEVETWAKDEYNRFEAFKQIPDIIDRLPNVTLHDLATSTVDPTLKSEIENVKTAITGETAKADEAAIRKTINDIKSITVK